MRFGLMMAGAFLFVAACGGGGNSGATGTATGGTSGTTGGGNVTTGGSSTGAPLLDGVRCSADAECESHHCGVDGTGNCCANSCVTNDGGCGGTSCDETGACVYPGPAITCGPDFCGADRLTKQSCNSQGACAPGTATSCPGNLGCNSAGTLCNTSCASSQDCAGGYVCNKRACVAPVHIGPCTENDDCYSKICGINGTGHCCYATTPCVTGDAVCGATDCDPGSGSCNYADAGTACGSVTASCSNGQQQSPSVCDGKGACPAPAMVPCAPFTCGPTACRTTCSDDTSCGIGDFCDLGHSSCCPGLITGDSVYVDATGGNDAAACCSLPGYPPCQTIAQTMKLIDNAHVKGVTINAAVHLGSTWNPPAEVYPIVLGWGVELKAPGVFFYDPNAANTNGEVIDIAAYSPTDTIGYASLVGSTGAPVSIGMDEFRDQATDPSAIKVEPGNTLYLANASVNGSENKDTTAITVAAGATLVLAQDRSAGVTGTVTIGNAFNNSATNGYKGIVCGTGNGQGCTISDAALKAGKSSLVIEGQAYVDIDAEDYSVISLTSAPTIGLPPASTGFLQCVAAGSTATVKPDVQANSGVTTSAAVLLNGLVDMTFDNGTVQCIEGNGFLLNASPSGNGNPTLTLVNTTIQNTELGVKANAGSATISASTIWYNFNGVEQGTDGTNVSAINLSSGGDGGTTTVVCSSYTEGVRGHSGAGASVINTTSSTLNAQNVDWDTSGPDLFKCNSALSSCTCQLSSCTVSVVDAGFNGLDAVTTSTGTIDTSGNGLSSASCGTH